ncbi:MAG: primosomal protein N' [Oscillospiraceae bacterium]|jgi:primosomal protein N' (replication factor Y)|nr:primosomal protein N' [Oscillospiraceae bacterium]
MLIAKVAVAAATVAIDRPYDYAVPDNLSVAVGSRVTVPFGRGNRRCEGVVLALGEDDGTKARRAQLKNIDVSLDKSPVLDADNVRLAVWISDRFFCTVYEALRAMLPAGMWFKDGVQRARDKTVKTVMLAIPAEEAVSLAARVRARSPKQADVLETLARTGEVSQAELTYFTGASGVTIKTLEKRGAVRTVERETFRRPQTRVTPQNGELTLNDEQTRAYERLTRLLHGERAEAALLYGVTGSGKTSVYIKLIQDALDMGKSAVVLVPEIALTPQLVGIFASRFGDNVAVLHSALSVGERYDEWKRIRSGAVRVAVGTRSAVFAPVRDLGLIILDEEQEHTYKSENAPRYHAREVAKFRCVHAGAMLVLGSATPSIESMYAARSGKYELVRLDTRYNEKSNPGVIIADMKRELRGGNGGSISEELERELHLNIERGEQSILFINRRGTSSLIACGECGHTFGCERCSVSLTYHSANGRLMCHYCGFSMPRPDSCPECGGKLRDVGTGTQRVEVELKAKFPGVKIVRMDADTVSLAHSHEKLLSSFRDGKAPILLGTQMVAKGLDFENVTLVGVLLADMSLYVNDYRANERTFSLIAQVVGRCGRGVKPGRAVIQTYTPENEVIQLASRQDYDAFYEREITLRAVANAPPTRDLLTLTASGLDETAVLAACVRLRATLDGYFKGTDTRILGPAPAAVAKINNRFRYRVSLMCENNRRARDIISHTVREFAKDAKNRGVSAFADVDPFE